eukprot:6168938-Amphidinium_carterae.1
MDSLMQKKYPKGFNNMPTLQAAIKTAIGELNPEHVRKQYHSSSDAVACVLHRMVALSNTCCRGED